MLFHKRVDQYRMIMTLYIFVCFIDLLNILLDIISEFPCLYEYM